MKYWSISSGDRAWAVKLDIRDLGGHLDVTRRAWEGTLNSRDIEATSQVHMVSALPFGFLGLVGLVRSKFLPAGLHGPRELLFRVSGWMLSALALYGLVGQEASHAAYG